jgi:DNA-binding NtrC family response regulator
MNQATAVVLNKDQNQREEIRSRLSHCGVLSICFKDEWICLENIHHIEPSFAVLGTDSCRQLSRFVNLSKAIKSNFPIMVLSQENNIADFVGNNWLDNLFFLGYPAAEKQYQEAIESLASVKREKNQPVLVAGSTDRKKLLQGIPLLGLARDPILIQGERGVGKKLIATAIHGFSTDKRARLEFIDATNISDTWILNTIDYLDTNKRNQAPHKAYAIKNIDKLPFSLQSQLLLLMEKIADNGTEVKAKKEACQYS